MEAEHRWQIANTKKAVFAVRHSASNTTIKFKPSKTPPRGDKTFNSLDFEDAAQWLRKRVADWLLKEDNWGTVKDVYAGEGDPNDTAEDVAAYVLKPGSHLGTTALVAASSILDKCFRVIAYNHARGAGIEVHFVGNQTWPTVDLLFDQNTNHYFGVAPVPDDDDGSTAHVNDAGAMDSVAAAMASLIARTKLNIPATGSKQLGGAKDRYWYDGHYRSLDYILSNVWDIVSHLRGNDVKAMSKDRKVRVQQASAHSADAKEGAMAAAAVAAKVAPGVAATGNEPAGDVEDVRGEASVFDNVVLLLDGGTRAAPVTLYYLARIKDVHVRMGHRNARRRYTKPLEIKNPLPTAEIICRYYKPLNDEGTEFLLIDGDLLKTYEGTCWIDNKAYPAARMLQRVDLVAVKGQPHVFAMQAGVFANIVQAAKAHQRASTPDLKTQASMAQAARRSANRSKELQMGTYSKQYATKRGDERRTNTSSRTQPAVNTDVASLKVVDTVADSNMYAHDPRYRALKTLRQNHPTATNATLRAAFNKPAHLKDKQVEALSQSLLGRYMAQVRREEKASSQGAATNNTTAHATVLKQAPQQRRAVSVQQGVPSCDGNSEEAKQAPNKYHAVFGQQGTSSVNENGTIVAAGDGGKGASKGVVKVVVSDTEDDSGAAVGSAEDHIRSINFATDEDLHSAIFAKDASIPSLRIGRHTVTVEDLSTLRGDTWLNDVVINSLLAEIVRQPRQVKVYAMDSHFWTKYYYNDFEYDSIKRWGTHNDEENWVKGQHGCVLFPVNWNNLHWALVVLDVANRRVWYLDSQPTGDREAIAVRAMIEYAQLKTSVPWAHATEGNISSRQTDGCACGVFLCENAAEFVAGERVAMKVCTQPAVSALRKEMAVKVFRAGEPTPQ